MFVNRTRELAELDRWWATPSGRPCLVWGRRRVGKTALLQEFGRDRRVVFHTGAGRSAAGELAQFSRQVAAEGLAGFRDLHGRPFVSWDDALEHLAEPPGDGLVLVVLDEYPELERSSPELPGVIRAFLDRVGGGGRLRLLVCGSAVRSMQAMQEDRAPLHGRFDLRLQVHPFEPWEAALLLDGVEPADQATAYGLLGGMPLYLSWWDADQDVTENLRRLVCRPGALLLTEGDLVLSTEAEPGGQASAVLYAIANGKTRHNEIKDWVRAEPTRTLDRLIELRLVERVVPVTEDPSSSRRRIYRIADNFLAFYLSLIARYRAEIDRGLGDSILGVLASSLDDHLGRPWEEMVRAHLRREFAAGRIAPDVVAVGPWWGATGQDEIDVLALAGRGRRPVLAGEVKWARSVDGARLERELRRKVGVATRDAEGVRLVVAAREAVRRLPEDALAVTAADVFGTGTRV